MALFGGKGKEVRKIYIPVDLVQNYSSKGMSEKDIVSRLKAQGFNDNQINRALEIALKETVKPSKMPEIREGPAPMGEVPPRNPEMGYPPERLVEPSPPRMQPTEAEAPVTFTFEKPVEEEAPEVSEVTVEEIVEGIVAERWEELEDKLNIFEKKDLQLQSQIDDLREKIDEIDEAIKAREKDLLSKLGEFGESMGNIEGRIGSIEKVFKEFLPDLTENIRLMSEIVEREKKR